MLYYFFDWINDVYQVPGFGVFQYISFRGVMALVFSLIISLLIGKRIINLLQKKQIGEVVRDSQFGPDHEHKKGTPTMGGLIILLAILIPVLLWGDLKNGSLALLIARTTLLP